MKPSAANASRSRRLGFTLAETLAALLLMAIVIPVAMQGVSVASRAGALGQRKAAAMRVAQRVLHEAMVTGGANGFGASGSVTENNAQYDWALERAPWPLDALEVVTVRVAFTLQGDLFDVGVSTLHDPGAAPESTDTAAGSASL